MLDTNAPRDTDAELEALLSGLNGPQREAVEHDTGPLLILAGAGSGKTRVLAHRIAYLIATDRANPSEILAITFTNKAAAEMRSRVELLVGRRTRAMWLMTFHSACVRMLRSHADKLGYKRGFTIYDQADSRRLVKRCLEGNDIDIKRYTPASVQQQISAAKNQLKDADAYAQEAGSKYEYMVAEAYHSYERGLHEMNAMDFDDLLLRSVELLERFPEVRQGYQDTFRYVMVDEYQDTNRVQYRWLELLAGESRNLMVVGDDSQCVEGGTQIAMADGGTRSVEEVRVGDWVRSGYGSGDFRPARVLALHRASRSRGIAITTTSGRRIVSTRDHVHFAGFRVGLTPQMHLTYVMWRKDRGFRVGTSRTYTNGQEKPVIGVATRTRGEKADAAWVVSTHSSEAEARFHEALLSVRYGIPTLPFVARRYQGCEGRSLAGDQDLLDRLFAEADTFDSGQRLLVDHGLDFGRPHFAPGTFTTREVRRRRLAVSLCGDHRGRTPMHRVALFGYDQEGRERLQAAGLSVRPARKGSDGWRFETVCKDMQRLQSTVDQIVATLDRVSIHPSARLGADRGEGIGNSLPFIAASAVRPGMAMFDGDGGYEIVASVEEVDLLKPVYDLDIENTHNFVANGLCTHNSIYGFRGADIRNILGFQDTFPDAKVVRLEQNYRSTQTILDAANAVIANNRGRMSKHLWTDVGQGDLIKLRELDDERAEARFVTGEVQRLGDEGTARAEIAIFYRTNAQSRVLQETLGREEIPYQVIGGTKFYDRAEIKDAIAYLTLLVNPQDAESFSRIVNSPRRGIGTTSVSRLLSHANTTGVSIWDAALAPKQAGLGSAAVKAIGRFMQTMTDLRERAQDAPSVAPLLSDVLEATGYLDWLRAERTIEAEGRLENLEALVNGAGEYDSSEDVEHILEDFLHQKALLADADERSDEAGYVTLMTLHNAKGLEYPIVFIIGCEEGVFPHSRALDEGDVEEERRLFYVGVTRAERDLYLTFARSRMVYGASAPGIASRFLAEIPPELIDQTERTVRWGRSYDGAPLRPRATSWASSSASGQAPSVPYRLGDDVVHPSFGEGVVTGIEPGGIVVIRFSKDRSERKLVAELAPISKR